jgi:hypothetical protein
MKNVGADIKFLGNLFEDSEKTIDMKEEGGENES